MAVSRYRELEESGNEEDDEPGSSTPLLNENRAMPKDRKNFSYFIFYLLGLGSLLPWNFFITAQDYWMYKLRDCNSSLEIDVNDSTVTVQPDNITSTAPCAPTKTSLQSLFMNSLAVCAMLPNVLFTFLNILLQKRISQNIRILFSLISMVILFIFTEILVKVDTCTWQEAFFTITLVSVVLVNSCSAVFQSSIFGLAAKFPQKFSGGVMAGQGMGGLVAAVAMIIALACSGDATGSTFIFFLIAIIVLIISILGYVVLTKQDFYQYYVKQFSSEKEGGYTDTSDAQKKILLENSVNGNGHTRATSGQNESVNISSPDNGSIYSSMLRVTAEIKFYMFCVGYTFCVTLACFPAVTGKIKSSKSGTSWTDVYFSPVCCFLLFNLGDWLGRTSASRIHFPSSTNKLAMLLCVIARTIFVFLFAFCNYQPRKRLPVVFAEDWMFVVFMLLFALSNGHLSTLCMQYGPKEVKQSQDSATAGSLLAFMISAGLFAGAGISFAITAWI